MGVITLLLGMICVSGYLWKEKGIAEAQVATQQQQQAQQKATLDWLSKGYLDLKRDNPKATKKYFP
jgi:hypothetical protein